jgi:hypothetical protein
MPPCAYAHLGELGAEIDGGAGGAQPDDVDPDVDLDIRLQLFERVVELVAELVHIARGAGQFRTEPRDPVERVRRRLEHIGQPIDDAGEDRADVAVGDGQHFDQRAERADEQPDELEKVSEEQRGIGCAVGDVVEETAKRIAEHGKLVGQHLKQRSGRFSCTQDAGYRILQESDQPVAEHRQNRTERLTQTIELRLHRLHEFLEPDEESSPSAP